MDFVCLGKDITGTDEDIMALMDQVIESSPPFSEFSSGESGVVSPGTFMEEDLFTTFFTRDHGGLALVEGELTSLQTTPITPPALPSKPLVTVLQQSQLDAAPKKAGTQTKVVTEDSTDRSKKNALAARLNRQKKKEYVHGLEDKVGLLSSENDALKRSQDKLEGEVARLRSEVEYLKSVLINQSALAGILRNLPSVTEVGLSSTIVGKRSRADNGTSQRHAKAARLDGHSGGVCIHVGQGSKASLEFCSHCSHLATSCDTSDL